MNQAEDQVGVYYVLGYNSARIVSLYFLCDSFSSLTWELSCKMWSTTAPINNSPQIDLLLIQTILVFRSWVRGWRLYGLELMSTNTGNEWVRFSDSLSEIGFMAFHGIFRPMHWTGLGEHVHMWWVNEWKPQTMCSSASEWVPATLHVRPTGVFSMI